MLRRLAVLFSLAIFFAGCASTPPPGEFTFVQIADTQIGMGGYEHDIEMLERAVEQINVLDPDFVIICGDLVEQPRDDKTYDDLLSVCSGFNMPVHYLTGNHDTGNTVSPENLDYYRNKIGPDYYRFDNKGYTFLAINTQYWNGGPPEEIAAHDEWLGNELRSAKSDNRPVIVAGHYPLYTVNPLEGEHYFNVPPEPRTEWLHAFYHYGVEAYLSGHAHKSIENEYMAMQLITAATTSLNFDDSPEGYMVWHIGPNRPHKHEYVPVN